MFIQWGKPGRAGTGYAMMMVPQPSSVVSGGGGWGWGDWSYYWFWSGGLLPIPHSTLIPVFPDYSLHFLHDRCPLYSYRSRFGMRPAGYGYGYGAGYPTGPNAAAAMAVAEMQAPLNPVGVGPVYPTGTYPPVAVPLMGASAAAVYPTPFVAPAPSFGIIAPVSPVGVEVGVGFGGVGVGMGVVGPVAPIGGLGFPAAPAVGIGLPVVAATPAYVDVSEPIL